MAGQFAAFVFVTLVLVLIEVTQADLDDEIPLSKSLGYSLKRSLTLDDPQLSREYLDLYQEMLKASRESYEKVDQEEAKLETIVGWEKANLMKRALKEATSHARQKRGVFGLYHLFKGVSTNGVSKKDINLKNLFKVVTFFMG